MFEDVQDKSIKKRLFAKTTESVEYMLKQTSDIPDGFINLMKKFVEEKWDKIFQMYTDHFPGADLEKVLKMMESDEYIKLLNFQVEYQDFLNKEMVEYLQDNDEFNSILDEESKKEMEQLETEAEERIKEFRMDERIKEIRDRENNADNDSFWFVDSENDGKG